MILSLYLIFFESLGVLILWRHNPLLQIFTPGNHAKKFLLNAAELLPALVRDKAVAGKIGKISELLYVIIRVLNTDKKINVAKYKHVCHMVGVLVISTFPWARMNETTHSVSHQILLLNDHISTAIILISMGGAPWVVHQGGTPGRAPGPEGSPPTKHVTFLKRCQKVANVGNVSNLYTTFVQCFKINVYTTILKTL